MGLTLGYKYSTMEEPIRNLLKAQIEVCKEITDTVKVSADLLQKAMIRVRQLEDVLWHLEMNHKELETKYKKAKKKAKKRKD
jgi:hypothetical protein